MVKHAVEPEELQALLDDELESSRRREVESHVSDCAECARLLGDLKRVSATLQQWQVAPAPASLRAPTVPEEKRRRSWLSPQAWWGLAASAAVVLLLVSVIAPSLLRWPASRQQEAQEQTGLSPAPAASAPVAESKEAPPPPPPPAQASPKVTYKAEPEKELAKKEAPEEPKAAAPALKVKPGVMADQVARSQSAEGLAGGVVNAEKVAPQAALSAPAAGGRESTNQALGTARPAAPSENENRAKSIAAPRWIAYEVTMAIEVKDFDAARAELEKEVAGAGGYISQASTQETPQEPRQASLTLRVPADQLQPVLAELRALGRVTSEQLSTDELTEQVVDLDARLRNARATEQRLRDVLEKRTGKVGEVLDVEREISSTREEVERLEAKRANLQNRVELATVNVTLAERFQARLQPAPPGAATRLRNALVEGYENFFGSVLDVAVFLARYGLVLLFWLGLAWVTVWPVLRRLGARAA